MRNERPVSLRPLSPISDKALKHLSDEHMNVLQRFFQFIIEKPTDGFSGDPPIHAHQSWDMMESCCAHRKYARQAARASWVVVVHPLQRIRGKGPSGGFSGIS